MSTYDDFQRFLAWADRKGYDTAHTYDSERNKYVCLNPALADAWEAWTESKYTPAPAQPAQWICEARFDNETRIIEGSFSPAQPSAQGVGALALEELHQLGYTVKDGLLYPPTAEKQPALAALFDLAAVLTGPDGKAGIHGSDGDMQVIDNALQTLRTAIINWAKS